MENEINRIGDTTIYLGSIFATIPEVLKSYNIKKVLNLSSLDIRKDSDVEYLDIKMNDTPDEQLNNFIDTCVKFIDFAVNSNQNILVNCYAGKSRSASILIAYFMIKRNLDFDTAFNYIKQFRNVIEPNKGFMQQLQDNVAR